MPIKLGTFENAWAKKEKAGYRYGKQALEQVCFGWDMCALEAAEIIEELENEIAAL